VHRLPTGGSDFLEIEPDRSQLGLGLVHCEPYVEHGFRWRDSDLDALLLLLELPFGQRQPLLRDREPLIKRGEKHVALLAEARLIGGRNNAAA
jgi:hypothetical protein